MSTAYEVWRETKEHLKQEPDSTFLKRVEESLRPAALLDYLGSFRGLDTYEEPLECTPDEAEEFLAKLDELRAPTQRDRYEIGADFRSKANNALTALRAANWTGDHTYGDALDDAREVLSAVFAGKPFPKLERFRCPSLIRLEPYPLRCELQLPHASKHRLSSPTGGMGTVEWTDEQSVNPPKSYDDEPVELTDQQLDKLASEVFGNPDPINRPLPEDTDGECGAVNPNPIRQGKSICVRAKLHDGTHRDADGIRWNR